MTRRTYPIWAMDRLLEFFRRFQPINGLLNPMVGPSTPGRRR